MGLIKTLKSAINPKFDLRESLTSSVLEKKLGYKFKDEKLLKEALTHPSFDNRESKYRNNQRLEFLGDSVVGCILARWLFTKFPKLAEGELSRKKSLLARRDNLAGIALKLNLQDYLIIGKSEKISKGNLRHSVLEDALEALVGAIFLDSDYITTEKVVLEWESFFLSALENESIHFNPKGKLQEFLQSQSQGQQLNYKVVNQSGPDHRRQFQVELRVNGVAISTGSGQSKKKAEEEAAQKAIKLLLPDSCEKD